MSLVCRLSLRQSRRAPPRHTPTPLGNVPHRGLGCSHHGRTGPPPPGGYVSALTTCRPWAFGMRLPVPTLP